MVGAPVPVIRTLENEDIQPVDSATVECFGCLTLEPRWLAAWYTSAVTKYSVKRLLCRVRHVQVVPERGSSANIRLVFDRRLSLRAGASGDVQLYTGMATAFEITLTVDHHGRDQPLLASHDHPGTLHDRHRVVSAGRDPMTAPNADRASS